jgi:hypothetical protein
MSEPDYATPDGFSYPPGTALLTFQHNAAPVAVEPVLSLDDSDVVWTLIDDPVNSRMSVWGTVTRLQGEPVAQTPPAANQGLVWTGASWAPASLVNSWAGRQGAVVPAAGDYTAAQVTNAGDKASAAEQLFASVVSAPNLEGTGNQSTNVAGGGAAAPNASLMVNQVVQTAGTSCTINNPGGLVAGRTMFFTVVYKNGTGATLSAPAITWGTAYRFGTWASQPGSMAVNGFYLWQFFGWAAASRVVCVGTSQGVFT